MPSLREVRMAVLGEPEDEDDAAPRESYSPYIFLLTALPRRNLKAGTKVLALREIDPTDMKWWGATVLTRLETTGTTTYYSIMFEEGPQKGETVLRQPHHRLVRDPLNGSASSEYSTQSQEPSMLGMPDSNTGHRFRIGDKLLLRNSKTDQPFTVTARLGNMLRIEGDGRDMFFPEHHVSLSLKEKGDPAKDPNKGNPTYEAMRPTQQQLEMYRGVNNLLPKVTEEVTADMVSKLLRHLQSLPTKQIVRRAIDPSYNPLISYSFLHWVMREDANGYFRIADTLFANGAVPDVIDFVGLTPLYNACVYGMLDVTRYLISHGADPLIPAPGLLTPVHLMLSDNFNIPDKLAEVALRRRRRQKRSMQSSRKDVSYNFTWIDHVRVKPPKKFFLNIADTGPWENHVGGESTLQVIIKDAHLGALGTPLVTQLIEHKWNSYAGLRARVDAVAALALAFMVVADTFLRPHKQGVESMEGAEKVSLAVSVTLGIWSLGLCAQELFDLLSDRELWFLDFWNPIELTTYVITLVYSAGDLATELSSLPGGYERWIQLAQAASAFFVWVRLLKYVAIFDGVGHLVNVIIKMLTEFAIFIAVFAAIFLGFTHAFYVLTPAEGKHGPESVLDSVMTAFQMMVGEFDYETYSTSGALVVLFVAYILIAMVLMLNLLIAQLSNVYSEVSGDAKAQFFLNRARLTLEKEKQLTSSQRLMHSARRIRYAGHSLPTKIVTSIFEEEAEEAAEAHERNMQTLTKLQLEERLIAAAKDPEEELRAKALMERLHTDRGGRSGGGGAGGLDRANSGRGGAAAAAAVPAETDRDEGYEDVVPERRPRGPGRRGGSAAKPCIFVPCMVPGDPAPGRRGSADSTSSGRFRLPKFGGRKNATGTSKSGSRIDEEDSDGDDDEDEDLDLDDSESDMDSDSSF
eukprot:CAMPEP_0185161620 /NCGR_PEP_ID=MMETSP1139-20130426/5255_1 /TAXON_ID=298111 /ORGANISM="Pavlova sp., Strain CCMP459" /LENGTH=915 /DNA_ID=CAMNT_0027726895 /DNA_START=52 /DNA_END=2799 /DNA_ORIENTATION=-